MLQVSPVDSVFDELLKHSISLGILFLVLIMLYREWKEVRAYRKQQDEALIRLTEESTRTIERAGAQLERLAEKIDDILNRVEDK